MRSLREMNVSKLVADDVPLFSALLEDLFPSQKVQTKQVVGGEKDAVLNALASICRSRGLEPEPAWIKKCMQLYETYLVRHGIMVIGPPGSGKSMAVDCLASALTEIGQKTVVLRMNPKAITAPQMFGRLDPATGDWTDGVFSNMWRRASRAPKGQSTWIVLDGPVDAVWIENLNTVLDDNKVLTLANGDRIAMSPQMRLIFEAENLKNASPATVSRAGIIYMSSSELGWRPLIQSWLLPKAPRERAALGPLFDKYLPPSLDFVRLECTPVVILEETCLVTTLCTMLTGALSSEDRHEGVLLSAKWIGAFSNDVHGLQRAYERCFLLCLSWAVGGVLCQEDRCRYDHLLRGLASTFMPEVIDGADTIFDYGIDENLGTWIPWHQKVPAWTPPHDRQAKRPAASSMMIPTVDSVRYDWILSTVRAAGGASLLVGATGTAKTTIVQQYLSHFDMDSHIAKTITFSSLTTPHIFQTALEGFVDKIQGRTYGPPGGKIATIFLDDLSMPAINKWGDQETNELVRQVLEQKGWYSTNKPVGELKSLIKVSFVAAMGLPGRKDIPNRLKRQFCIFHLPPPSKKSLKGIFGQLMDIHFGTYTGETLSNTAQQVVSATISLLQATQRYLVPTPSKFHYSFTMRDISKVFQGIMTADMNALSGSAGHGTVTKLPGGGAAAAAAALTSSQYLVILWAHECRRVFADKLISHEDALWLDAQILKAAGEYFSIDVMEAARQSSTVFVDFLRDPELEESTGEPIGPRPKCYELVPGGFSQTRSRIEVLVEEGYRSGLTGDQAPPRLVLFDDALAHAVRIARILSMERGSALLVGVEGSGKQSLARLAAYLAGVSIFKITQSKSYGIANLLEDLRAIYKAAAFQPQPLMLLLTESEIRHESFLEYFNQILMTGEVAGLFPRDEMDVLLSDIRPLMRSTCPALPDTRDNLYSFFINRVRDRLHIVLCVSPMGGRLSRWAVQFPGIINGCTIDWFLPWPDDALLAVSSVMLQPRLQAARKVMAVAHAHVSSACNRYRQEQGRSVFFTPKSYISALNVLQTLHERKSQELQTLNHQLKTGLEKMDDAKTDVNEMSVQLAAKEIELEKSNDEAAKLLEEIKESTLATEKEKSKVANIVQSVRQKVR